MKKFLVLIVTVFLFTTGCSLNKDNITNKTNKNEEDIITTEKPTSESIKIKKVDDISQVKTQEDLFNPPHFVLKSFDIEIKENKKVYYIIEYVIDSDSNNFLKNHHPILYFNILYPYEIQQDIKKTDTKVTRFDSSYSQKLIKKIVITDEFDSKFNVEKLKDPSLNFQLQVLNQNKQMFHLFDDLNVYRVH